MSQTGDYKRSFPLDDNMGIFRRIFDIEFKNGKFEMFVETLDDRLVVLIFDEPTLSLII